MGINIIKKCVRVNSVTCGVSLIGTYLKLNFISLKRKGIVQLDFADGDFQLLRTDYAYYHMIIYYKNGLR